MTVRSGFKHKEKNIKNDNQASIDLRRKFRYFDLLMVLFSSRKFFNSVSTRNRIRKIMPLFAVSSFLVILTVLVRNGLHEKVNPKMVFGVLLIYMLSFTVLVFLLHIFIKLFGGTAPIKSTLSVSLLIVSVTNLIWSVAYSANILVKILVPRVLPSVSQISTLTFANYDALYILDLISSNLYYILIILGMIYFAYVFVVGISSEHKISGFLSFVITLPLIYVVCGSFFVFQKYPTLTIEAISKLYHYTPRFEEMILIGLSSLLDMLKTLVHQ